MITVLGLEDSRPVSTPSVKRTPTTESLVELGNEKRAVYRTAVGKLLHMCQERADFMYSVKETARKITCPTESDEMNVKRIVRHLKGVPSAKCSIEINRFPPLVNVYTDSDWAGQHQTCKRTRGGVTQWRSATLSAWSAVSELEFCRSRMTRSDNWNFRRDGDEASLERTGIRSDTLKPRRQSICEGMGIQTRFLGPMKHVMLKYVLVQDVVEKKQTTLADVNTNSNKGRLDDKSVKLLKRT